MLLCFEYFFVLHLIQESEDERFSFLEGVRASPRENDNVRLLERGPDRGIILRADFMR